MLNSNYLYVLFSIGNTVKYLEELKLIEELLVPCFLMKYNIQNCQSFIALHVIEPTPRTGL